MALNVQNENGGSWITSRRFAVFLGILIFVSWPGVLLGLQTFVFRDFGFFSAPIAWHLRLSFWRMELPLWNPLSNCGQPFLAEWNTQVLYPPALVYVLLPFPWSLGAFCLLHLFLGGLGMFFLARDWTQNSFAAALAGVIFAFSGLMTGSFLWPSIISALGWMPWVVWLTRRAWREGGRLLVLAAFAGALQMLSGGVEVVILTWTFLAAVLVIDFLSKPRARAHRFLVVILFVAGLSAAQLFPFIDFMRHSERVENYFTADSPMPATGWVNFLVPLFRDESAQGIFFQNGQYWVLSYYTGVITVALAAVALRRRRRADVWALGLLSVLFLVLASGNATPLYGWVAKYVPLFGSIRFPVKFIMLPVFMLPLMAAFALAGESAENQRTGRWSWPLVWFITVGLIFACLVWAAREPALNLTRAVVINGLVRAGFFTVIVFGLIALERFVPSDRRHWVQVFVLVLVWLDLIFHAPQPPLVNPVVFRPNMPRPTPPPRFGSDRAMIPPDVLNTLTFAANPDATQNFLSDRFSLFSDCNLYDDIPKCDGFFPINIHEMVLLNGHVNAPIEDFLGVSQSLAIRQGALVWTPRQTFMPLLTGGQRPLFASPPETLKLISGTNFNPRTEVYLPLESRGAVTVSNTASVTVLPLEYSAQKIRARVDASSPAMLVAAQAWYHPWHAYVDGKPTPLWRANYAFQALQVPTGAHEVKLVYVDWSFRIGLVLSTLALTGAILFYWLSGVVLKTQSSRFRNWP